MGIKSVTRYEVYMHMPAGQVTCLQKDRAAYCNANACSLSQLRVNSQAGSVQQIAALQPATLPTKLSLNCAFHNPAQP